MPCKQGMWHPTAPCVGGVASCAPPACGSPLHAFPVTCCSCTHVPASNAQNLPPAGWLLPKGQGAGARAGCRLPVLLGRLPMGPSLPGIARGNSVLCWGNLPPCHREGAARVGPVQGHAQHLAAHVCEDGQVFGDIAGPRLSPSNAVHPCMSGATLLAIRTGLVVGSTSQGDVLDGQR